MASRVRVGAGVGRGLVLALVLGLGAGILGASHAFRWIPPCGETPGVTVRIRNDDLGATAPNRVYEVTAVAMSTTDVERIRDAVGLAGAVVVTPSGFRVDREGFEPLEISRSAIGWAISGSVGREISAELLADRREPRGKRTAEVVARRLVERLGILTDGWRSETSELPGRGVPRSVELTPALDGRPLPFTIPPWGVDVYANGRLASFHGDLSSMTRVHGARILDPRTIARALTNPERPYATEALILRSPTKRDPTPLVVPLISDAPPGIRCAGTWYGYTPYAAILSGRIASERTTRRQQFRVDYEITAVRTTFAFVAASRRTSTLLVAPAYEFEAIARIAGRPEEHVTIGPELAVDPEEVLASVAAARSRP